MNPFLKLKLEELASARDAYKKHFDAIKREKQTDGSSALAMSSEQYDKLQELQADVERIAAEAKQIAGFDEFSKKNNEALDAMRSTDSPTFDDKRSTKADGQYRTTFLQPEYSKEFPDVILLTDRRSVGEKAQEVFDELRKTVGGKIPSEFQLNIPGVHLKALLLTSTGFPPESLRTGDVVPLQTEQTNILDSIPFRESSENSVVFMRQTTRTNTAAETVEGDAAPEAVLAWVQATEPHRQIAVTIPATVQQLEDVGGLQNVVENDLVLMLRQRLATQVVKGDGVGENMTGVENTAGIQTQPFSVTLLDTYLKAATKIRTDDFSEPSAFWIHPTDWQNIQLEKDTAGRYLLGDPGLMIRPSLWGIPVVQATQVTEGKALVGDFANHTYISFRTGMEVEMATQHDTDFEKWINTFRARVRAVLIVRRANAICQATLA